MGMRTYGWWLVSGALIVAGVAMVAASHAWPLWGPFSGGGVGYEVETLAASDELPAVADPQLMWAGMSLVVVGLLVMAAGIGYRAGLRTARRP